MLNRINFAIQNIYKFGRYNSEFRIVLFPKDIKSKPFCLGGRT